MLNSLQWIYNIYGDLKKMYVIKNQPKKYYTNYIYNKRNQTNNSDIKFGRNDNILRLVIGREVHRPFACNIWSIHQLRLNSFHATNHDHLNEQVNATWHIQCEMYSMYFRRCRSHWSVAINSFSWSQNKQFIGSDITKYSIMDIWLFL